MEHIDRDLAVVILAAGKGTRMKSHLPKVLHQIGGRPLVGHVLDTARDLGPAHVVVVVRHERDRVADAVMGVSPEVVVADQDEIAGTGRAVEVALQAIPDFVGDVLVLSGDVPLIEAETLADLIAAHRAAGTAATLLSAIVDDPFGYGRVIRGENDDVLGIVEQAEGTDEQLAVREINSGVYVFHAPELRTHLPLVGASNTAGERYLTDVIALLRASRLAVTAAATTDVSVTLGVNDRAQLAEAGVALNRRTVRKWMREGVTIQDPATTWIDKTVTLAPDVTILPNTQLQRATVVASGAVIGPDTTLTDCEVGEDAVVKRTDGTLAVVGARASVGPFAYLRPGTYLGENGKIGTFVETKNSTIGSGSKVPHLSYVGDAEVGVETNIGAGTIVANYDGVSKNRTVVGSHARTGSHNVFVAPVRIADGAYTGAGTVVRKDVPPGALAITVASQRNVEGWVERHRPGTAAAKAAEEAPDGTQEDG